MKVEWKMWRPHLFAVITFLVISIIYCKPALEGMAIEQHDLIQWKGMAQDAFDYKEQHGIFPLWTQNLFSGMPNYNIAFESNAVIPAYIIKVMSLFLPEPFSYFFLACIGFYLLTQVLRIRPLIGVLASIGFAYCSYDPIIVAVGHHTKMVTMALMPALLAALILLYNKKYWIGGALTAAFTAALIVNNHLQIIYYMLLVIIMMTIAYVISWIKRGEFGHMLRCGFIAIAAAGLGAATSAVNLLTTYDYSKESMRGGKAQLLPPADSTAPVQTTTTGLDVDYAFRWSYGIPETLTFLVPNANGGVSESLGESSTFYEKLMEVFQSGQVDQQGAQAISRFGVAYWGNQPFTSGPVYFGAVIVVLFLLGMMVPSNKHRWWALVCIVLAIIMAWGSNLPSVNNFLFNYLPMYNKFRAPAMILVIPQLLLPMIAALGLNALLDSRYDEKIKWQWLKQTAYAAGGLLVLALVYYVAADFQSASEAEMMRTIGTQAPQLKVPAQAVLDAAGEDRKSLYLQDLGRSAAFVLLTLALLWLSIRNKLAERWVLLSLIVITLIDLVTVGKRYLNEDNYKVKEDVEARSYVASTNPPLYNAFQQINQDKDPHFRVFNLTLDVFNDALSSALVRSIGGYHPAKLSLYQDMIEYQLSASPPNIEVLNMLDTRYFIVPGQNGPVVQRNPEAYGAAWLVKHITYVKDAAAEMLALNNTNLHDTAIVQQNFASDAGNQPKWDSAASIALTEYDHDKIKYAVNAPEAQFAVLSEIYYASGWHAYANDKEVPLVKVNYALRGVALPAGTQSLELRFEPASYSTGRKITSIASWLVIAWLIAGLAMYLRQRNTDSHSAS